MTAVSVTEGFAPHGSFETWYRVSGDLSSPHLPLVNGRLHLRLLLSNNHLHLHLQLSNLQCRPLQNHSHLQRQLSNHPHSLLAISPYSCKQSLMNYTGWSLGSDNIS